MKFKIIFLNVLIVLSSLSVFSADDEIGTMKVPPRQIQEVLQLWSANPQYIPTAQMLKNLAQFPTGEAFLVAYERLGYWIFRNENLQDSEMAFLKESIFGMIELMGEVGQHEVHVYKPSEDALYVHDAEVRIQELVELVDTQLVNAPYYQEVRDALLAALEKIQNKPKNLVGSLNLHITRQARPTLQTRELPSPSESENGSEEVQDSELFKFTTDRISFFRTFLNQRLHGQQRLKDRYLNVLYEIATFGLGKRRVPNISAYKMGAPGNGKDTSAEAFVDALFLEENAYAKLEDGVPFLFRLPVMKSNADYWKVIGSAKGYVGSHGQQRITPFVRWLVKFSAGRYQIAEDRSGREPEPYIMENPDWKPGMVLEGYYPPEMGVLFVNEFHNWSKVAKDDFLKQFLEKGYISLNDPGPNGVSELYVPVNIDIASNEGIALMSPREADGRVVGNRPKTYEEAQAAYAMFADKPDTLRREILKTNGFDSVNTQSEMRRGISEEVLNRIPDAALILMEYTSPETLQLIAIDELTRLNQRFSEGTGQFGKISFTWTSELPKFIQEYHYNPEANARPIKGKVESLVRDTIFDAIKEGFIRDNNGGQGHQFALEIEVQEDRTAYLVFKNPETNAERFRVLIKVTVGDRPRVPMTNEQLAPYLNLQESLQDELFGMERVLEKAEVILTNIAVSVNRRRENFNDHSIAQTVGLFGISGAGKTAAVKAIADKILPGGVDDLFVIDFNNIHTTEQLTEKLYGLKYGDRYTKSDFMNHYDRISSSNGIVYVLLDEIAKSAEENPGVLAPLYPFFDEPVVKNFSDNEPRPMSNVVFLMTGNVGTKMYNAIPKNIPETEKMAAYMEMFRQFLRDDSAQRYALEREMPGPLVNRVPSGNIIWFGPHNFQTVRQISMKEIQNNIGRMTVKEGDRGWNIAFDSEKDYLRLVELAEEAGFTAESQGRGVRNYLDQAMSQGTLKNLLVRNNVPSDSEVILVARDEHYERQFRGSLSSLYLEARDNDVIYDVLLADGRKLEWRLPRNERQFFPTVREEDQIITAAHEAGHNIVGHLLMGDKYMLDAVTIIPGVAMIGDRWIRYLGLASSDEKEIFMLNKQTVVAIVAGLLAGSEAQKLVTVGARDDAGKDNDIERANEIISYAIIKGGVFSEWGNYSVNSVSELSSERRRQYEHLLNRTLEEARALAHKTLVLNYDTHLVPMMVLLAEKGILIKSDLEQFYAERTAKNPFEHELETSWLDSALNYLKSFFNREQPTTRDAQLLPELPRPASVSGTEQFVRAQKDNAVSNIQIPNSAPIRGNVSSEEQQAAGVAPLGGSCSTLFGGI